MLQGTVYIKTQLAFPEYSLKRFFEKLTRNNKQ